MPRNTKVDAKGKVWLDSSGRKAYELLRLEKPLMSHRQVALELGVPKKQAREQASRWERNPFTVDALAMSSKKDTRNAYAERDAWIKRVKRRGTRAEAAEQFAAALKSDDMLAERIPMEGVLNGKDVAKVGDTINLDFSSWTNEEIAALLVHTRAKLAEGKVLSTDGRPN